jgi:hypothetical protein
MRKTGERSTNALKEELVIRAEAASAATPETVYGLLADLSSHLVWAGKHQAEKSRLLTLDAPAGRAVVGTVWSSSGVDPMGTFADRSVVTEATPSRAFEYVTEARLTTKKGVISQWTNVVRYEVEPTAGGSRIVSTGRIVRISAMPGMLALFNVRGLRELAVKASASVSRRTVRSLARYAEERESGGR